MILEIGRDYELDLSLLTHLKFLDRVHEQFYAIPEDQERDIKKVIVKCLKTVLNKNYVGLFDLLYFG